MSSAEKDRAFFEKGSVFARLIEPVSAEQFFSAYFETEAFVLSRNTPDFFQDLLTLAHLDEILSARHPYREALNIVNASASSPITANDYSRPDGSADPARVTALFADGATLIFNQLHRSHLPLAKLCARLEEEWSHPFQANAYLTPPSKQGFKFHYDTHDVFVLQVAGSKDWTIYGAPLELPLKEQSSDSSLEKPGPVTLRCTLRQGDVLYLPRGLVHEAHAGDETSLHITVGALCYTWANLMIDAATELCLRDAVFRKSLPVGFARPGFNRGTFRAKFKELLERLARESNCDNVLDDAVDHFIGTRHLPLPGQLKAVEAARNMTGSDLLAPRRPLVYRLSAGPSQEQITIRVPGAEIVLPAYLAQAIRFALEQPLYTSFDLPVDLPEADKLKLAFRLVREGLVEPVRPDNPVSAIFGKSL